MKFNIARLIVVMGPFRLLNRLIRSMLPLLEQLLDLPIQCERLHHQIESAGHDWLTTISIAIPSGVYINNTMPETQCAGKK
jgi:hypothetical protein